MAIRLSSSAPRRHPPLARRTRIAHIAPMDENQLQEVAAAVRSAIEDEALTGAIIPMDGSLHPGNKKPESGSKISCFRQETSRNG